jgi:hypothetical protein
MTTKPYHLAGARAALLALALTAGLAPSAHGFVPLLLRSALSREAALSAQAARGATAATAARSTGGAAAGRAGAVAARTEAVAAPTMRAAATKGPTKAIGPAARVRPAGKPVYGFVSRTRHPAAAAHMTHAQRNGQPSILTIERSHARERRAQSLRHIRNRDRRPGPGHDRDEYPPAMFKEGGGSSNVRYINQHDNRGAGKSLERQLKSYRDGTRVRMVVND